MNKTTELLQQAKTFYIATMDGDQPRVRPFGAVAEFDGKTYIAMNNTKNVYRQLMENPKAEICAMIGGNWFRMSATLSGRRNDARAEFLKQSPIPMYKADDGIFEIFYLTEVKGKVDSFGGPAEEF